MVLLDSPRYFRIGFIFNFNDVFIFKFLNFMLSWYLLVEPTPPGCRRPIEQVLPGPQLYI
jgi:hypothetical protein